MNCAQSEKHLENYVDGGVSAAICERIKAHLAGCLSCRERFQAARTEMDRWRRLLAPEKAPESLADRVMAAIHRPNGIEEQALSRRRGKSYRVPRSSRWVAAAACLALLAGFGLTVMSDGQGKYHSSPYPVPVDTGTPTYRGMLLSSPTPCSVSRCAPLVPTPQAHPLLEGESEKGVQVCSAPGSTPLG